MQIERLNCLDNIMRNKVEILNLMNETQVNRKEIIFGKKNLNEWAVETVLKEFKHFLSYEGELVRNIFFTFYLCFSLKFIFCFQILNEYKYQNVNNVNFKTEFESKYLYRITNFCKQAGDGYKVLYDCVSTKNYGRINIFHLTLLAMNIHPILKIFLNIKLYLLKLRK